LHIATFSSLSFTFDPLIVWMTWYAWGWDAMIAQIVFMCWTKVIKLIGLFTRNPADLKYLPLSILFGWFHGFIKLYALATLKMVSHV
jgi:hypothetical protein